MLMIEPGPGSISASALRVVRNTPRRLIAISRSQSATLYSCVRDRVGGDAGVVDQDVDARVVGGDRLPHVVDRGFVGDIDVSASALPRDCLASDAVSSAPSRLRSAQITVAPNAARPSANERPRPLPAPVTTAILPSRRNRFSNIAPEAYYFAAALAKRGST